MSEINWQMAVPPNIGETFLNGFNRGQAMRQERDKRNALATYASTPDSPEAARALLAVAPEIGLKVLEQQRAANTRSALSDYVIANRMPSQGPASVPGNALQPASVPPASIAPPTTTPDKAATPGVGSPAGQAGTDWSFLGAPKSAADQAFLRAVRADPVKALEIDSHLRDNFVKRAKAERDLYDMAVSRLAGVSDEAGYQAVISEAERLGAPMGIDVRTQVPPTFPGADGLQQLRMRALGAKDQLNLLLREADAKADNARADRNTDSQIADREARTGIARDRVSVSRDLGERRDATTRRGQDLRDGTTRRGQDLRGSGRPKIVEVKTPEEAAKLAPGTTFRTPDGRVKVR